MLDKKIYKNWMVKNNIKYLLVLLFLIMLVCLYPQFIRWSESYWINIPIITKYENIRYCKSIVLKQLTAPYSTKFSDIVYSFKKNGVETGNIIQTLSGKRVDIISGGYIRTQLKNNEIILENNRIMSENDKNVNDFKEQYLYSNWTRSEFKNRKENAIKIIEESIRLSDLNLFLMESNVAIGEAMNLRNHLIITGNIDSQNSYGVMVRGIFSCYKIKGEDMYAEVR